MADSDIWELPFVYEVLDASKVKQLEAGELEFDPANVAFGVSFQREHVGNMKFARLKVPQGIPDWAITFTPETLRKIAYWIEAAE